MTLPAALDRLWGAVHQLRDEAQTLRLHALEDRPAGEPSKLIDDVGTASLTLAGWVEEALERAAEAVAAGGYPADLARLGHALGACGEATERAAAQVTDELASTRRLGQLGALARAGGRERRAWVAAIEQALDRVNPSAWAVAFALTDSWRELAERAPGGAPATARADGPLPAAGHDAPPTGSERRP
jgi:hypothetical protein